MFKPLRLTLGIVLLSASLVACTSPEEKAANHLENAKSLFAEGKLTKAEIEYKNALQINQNLPAALFGLARIHERKQDWRKTYAVLSKIREIAPGHVNGRIMLGQFLLAANQIDQALNDAKEILEMAPDDARSHSLMATVHFRLENLKGAQEEFEKALAIDPGNIEALLVNARVLITEKKYKQAFQILDKAIETDPDNVSMYLMKIQAYQEKGDKKGVEGVFLELVEHFPDNPAFKIELARQYIKANDIESAERMLEQIIEADPANVDEKLRLVGFKNRHRSTDDAIALLQTYIDYDKKEYRYRFSLGEIYEINGQFDKAASIYRGIITDDELKANGLEARNKIALIELRAGNRDKAATFVSEVLAQDKNNENSLLLQASLELADQNYDEAVVRMRTVLRDNPDSIKALALLGQAYEAMGSVELAVESYTRAFQLDPGTPNIANQLAKSLVRQRKFSKADEFLQESISRGNRSVETIKLMAQIKLSLGEWDNAEQLANQLQEIEGQEALSQQVLGVVYQGKQEQEASIEAFKRAHELAPASAQPIVALVRNYVSSGKVTDAKRFLNAVISVHTDNTTAHLLLGQLSLYENDSSGAIAHFERVIEINPKLDAGYSGLMSTYMRDNELEKAEMVGNQGLSAIPGRPQLVMILASIYEKQRNYGKAIETYESLLEKNPDLIVAKNNLASLLTDYGGDQASLDKARGIAKDLRDSPIPQFRDTYAWVTVKSGASFEEAVAILKGIVKENDEVDVYSYHLGEAYRQKGDAKTETAYLNKALELARPDSDIAQKAKHSLQQLNQ
jgi:FimV-like protein